MACPVSNSNHQVATATPMSHWGEWAGILMGAHYGQDSPSSLARGSAKWQPSSHPRHSCHRRFLAKTVVPSDEQPLGTNRPRELFVLLGVPLWHPRLERASAQGLSLPFSVQPSPLCSPNHTAHAAPPGPYQLASSLLIDVAQ